jgi:hypothetical protein
MAAPPPLHQQPAGGEGVLGSALLVQKPDTLVAVAIEQRRLEPQWLETVSSGVLKRHKERTECRRGQIAELLKRTASAEAERHHRYRRG